MQIGVEQGYISGIESGQRNPTVTTIGLLATALKVLPSELFSKAERRSK